MAAQEVGHTDRLAAGADAIGQQGGLRQGHDERRRNACFGSGLEMAHGLDAGAGACFWQSRTGTARASSTQIIVLEDCLNSTSKFKFELCHSLTQASQAGWLANEQQHHRGSHSW
jgi:hypothetical protein